MGLLSAFLPNAQGAGYWPFPAPAEERLAPLNLNIYGAYSGFTKCCRASMNRTIMVFNDPSLYQCKDELVEYLYAWRGDAKSLQKVEERQKQLVDVESLPWRSKPQYIAFLAREERLAAPTPADEAS